MLTNLNENKKATPINTGIAARFPLTLHEATLKYVKKKL